MLGFALIIALALAWDALGWMAQFMVGVGMAAGVGYMQGRELRPWIAGRWRWLWASVLGMGAPFVAWDVGAAIGVDSRLALPVCVVLGGLLVAVMQWRLLRPVSRRAILWLPACAAGWSLPALAIAMNDFDVVSDVWGTIFGLVGLFGGGALLGTVTGFALTRVVGPREPGMSFEPEG